MFWMMKMRVLHLNSKCRYFWIGWRCTTTSRWSSVNRCGVVIWTFMIHSSRCVCMCTAVIIWLSMIECVCVCAVDFVGCVWWSWQHAGCFSIGTLLDTSVGQSALVVYCYFVLRSDLFILSRRRCCRHWLCALWTRKLRLRAKPTMRFKHIIMKLWNRTFSFILIELKIEIEFFFFFLSTSYNKTV